MTHLSLSRRSINIAALAFLSSLALGSFLLIQPNGANADAIKCHSNGVISDAPGGAVTVTVTLDRNCAPAALVVTGVNDSIGTVLATGTPVAQNDGYVVAATFTPTSAFTSFDATIDGAFAATITQ